MPGYAGRTPFVGRERERTQLLERLTAAGSGEGSVTLVVGQPGIGKTRLVAELAERARAAGWTVAAGRAYETDGLPPYLPFIEALTEWAARCTDEELRSWLGAGATEVGLLLPVVSARLGDLPPPPPRSGEAARYYLFEGVSEALLRVARASTGLLLVLDDLQWADRATLLLLEHLARNLPGAPVLVVGAYRRAEVDRAHPLTATLAVLTREAVLEQVLLGPFTPEESAAAIEAIAGVVPAPSVAGILHRQTAGNPFFLREMTRHLVAEGRDLGTEPGGSNWRVPESVHQVLGTQLSRLSGDTVRLLEVAAVLGDGSPVDLLGSASGLAVAPLLDGLDAALRAGLLQETAGAYDFSHDLVRQALYAELPLHRRQQLHLRAADAIEHTPGLSPELWLARLAGHYRLAGPAADPAKALGAARRAGEAAAAVFAWDAVAAHRQAVLELWERQGLTDEAEHCELILSLAEAHTWTSDAGASREGFRRAATLARQLGEPRQLARAALGYGEYHQLEDDVMVRQADLLEEALATLPEAELTLRARVMGLLAEVLAWDGSHQLSKWDRVADLSRAAVTLARGTGDPATIASALNERQHALWGGPGDDEERLALGDEMVQLAKAAGDAELALKGHRWRFLDLLEMGDVAAADAEGQAFERRAAELRQPIYLWFAVAWKGMRALMDGRFEACERLIDQMLATLPRLTLQADYLLVALRREQGRLDEAEAIVHPWLRRTSASTMNHRAWVIRRALLYCDLGREAEARALFETLSANDFSTVARLPWGPVSLFLVEICTALGDRAHAAVLYDLFRPYAGRTLLFNVAALCHGAAAHYLGMLAATLERWDTGEAHFEDALTMHTRMGARPLLGHTLREYGALLLARGRPGDVARARGLLERADALYAELGMTYWRDRAARLLAGSGPVATAAPAYPAGLSEREVDVLRLVAVGHSNPAIAEALVLSINTVERHLTHILQKTGTANRTEAAAYATRHGLTG